MKPLRTIDVARRVGVSVNTVRAYEASGYLAPVPRAANGYRLFTEAHVMQAQMTRHAMHCTWLGGTIRQTALAVLTSAANGDKEAALTFAAQLIDHLATERQQAEAAIAVLENWVSHPGHAESPLALHIGETAQRLHVTVDELRSWERNGLLEVPRAPNAYRVYGSPEIDRLLVIRALRRARYSTMSILRLLHHLDAGQTDHLREILDAPPPEMNIERYPTDSWLSTLDTMQSSAQAIHDILQTLL